MPNEDIAVVRVERATERLRQERETFDQLKAQESRWFVLRLIMGYSAVVGLMAVIAICAIVLRYHTSFDSFVVKTATCALFVDVLGLLISVWKIVLNPVSSQGLHPVTDSASLEIGSGTPAILATTPSDKPAPEPT